MKPDSALQSQNKVMGWGSDRIAVGIMGDGEFLGSASAL